MKRDRGITELDSYLGNFTKEIQRRISQKGKVKILDAGCGYGIVMIELVKKFGDKVEVIGYNQNKSHGTVKELKERAVRTGIFTKEEINKLKNFPKIIYLDADKGLPFKNNSFDFVFSLASIYLYKDKIKFLEECNRILKKDGIARIQLFETEFVENKEDIFMKLKNSNNKPFWELWDKRKRIDFISYFEKIKGVKVKFGKREDNKHIIVYLEIKKIPNLDFKLRFVDYIDMRPIAKDRFGIGSIYTTELNIQNKKK